MFIKSKIKRQIEQVHKKSFGYLCIVYLQRQKGYNIVITVFKKIPPLWPNKLPSNKGANYKEVIRDKHSILD